MVHRPQSTVDRRPWTVDDRMVPWPIALVSLFYGLLTALSAVSLWKIVIGASAQSPIWPMVWLAVSVLAMCGLPFGKPWARSLAVWGFVALTVMTLSVAGLLVMGGKPVAALLSTMSAVVYLIGIRYLSRPMMNAWFSNSVGRDGVSVIGSRSRSS